MIENLDKINNLLLKIDERSKKYYKSIFNLNEKLHNNEINEFNEWVKKYLKNGFFEYIEFLKIINGLSFDGLFLFSLDKNSEYNFYTMNEEFWCYNDEIKQYICFGKYDLDYWFCKEINNGKYYIMDLEMENIINEYEEFEEMLLKVLSLI